MAKCDTITIRVKTSFVEDILNKIKKIEEDRGNEDTSYSDASGILRARILKAGGIK